MGRLLDEISRDFAWTAGNRWEPLGGRPRREQAWIAFGLPFKSRILAVILFRLKQWFRQRHVPVLPAVCDRLAILGWNVAIGNHTEIGAGLYLPHGNVVIDGIVTIGRHCVIAPWVTIGVNGTVAGPTIGDNVFIGTGAKILGGIHIGDNVRIGANAVVLDDVPSGATVVGIPARVVASSEQRATRSE
ncbi:MAG: serine acetyltransferase [Chloroflexi bacterium]|nr:serine acetyltransferase [Chloroflexota bacterium]